LDRSRGKAAIKSFVVDRDTPGFELVRLEHKLGIRASDTAHFRLDNVRVPASNLLGSPEILPDKGFAGVMQTFDNTRPLVAAMAVGIARAALEETRRLLESAGVEIDYDHPPAVQPAAAAAFLEMESDYEAMYLLTLQAAWMADRPHTRRPRRAAAPPRSHCGASSCAGARGTPSTSCWRSGPETPRSWTSSRGHNRSNS
jgi:acyl-CoA dehydrogenase